MVPCPAPTAPAPPAPVDDAKSRRPEEEASPNPRPEDPPDDPAPTGLPSPPMRREDPPPMPPAPGIFPEELFCSSDLPAASSSSPGVLRTGLSSVESLVDLVPALSRALANSPPPLSPFPAELFLLRFFLAAGSFFDPLGFFCLLFAVPLVPSAFLGMAVGSSASSYESPLESSPSSSSSPLLGGASSSSTFSDLGGTYASSSPSSSKSELL